MKLLFRPSIQSTFTGRKKCDVIFMENFIQKTWIRPWMVSIISLWRKKSKQHTQVLKSWFLLKSNKNINLKVIQGFTRERLRDTRLWCILTVRLRIHASLKYQCCVYYVPGTVLSARIIKWTWWSPCPHEVYIRVGEIDKTRVNK